MCWQGNLFRFFRSPLGYSWSWKMKIGTGVEETHHITRNLFQFSLSNEWIHSLSHHHKYVHLVGHGRVWMNSELQRRRQRRLRISHAQLWYVFSTWLCSCVFTRSMVYGENILRNIEWQYEIELYSIYGFMHRRPSQRSDELWLSLLLRHTRDICDRIRPYRMKCMLLWRVWTRVPFTIRSIKERQRKSTEGGHDVRENSITIDVLLLLFAASMNDRIIIIKH